MSNEKYRIAVLGDQASVLGFKALGLDVYPAETVEAAREILHRLAKSDTAIIYLTEQLAQGLEPEIARSSSSPARTAAWASVWPTSRAPWSGR